jgi:hypothetical protein
METASESNLPPENGEQRIIDNIERVFFDGYWIRYYAPLQDTLANRKRLIDSLTRRAFHHTEAGINTPGRSLELAREAYASETDPERKRVNAAMLAGALFHRATDLFTTIVDLGELGVQVSENNELMRQCSDCFEEALTTMPIADFYESRFIKIAQGMREIDQVADCMIEVFCSQPLFAGLEGLIVDYSTAARQAAETMKKDPIIFQVWPNFVSLGEKLDAFRPRLPDEADQMLRMRIAYGRDLIQEGRLLISYIASARVPMTKSADAYNR